MVTSAKCSTISPPTTGRKSSKTRLLLKPSASVHERVAEGCRRLRDAGLPKDEADLDARLLAQFVLGWTAERYLTARHGEMPEAVAEQFAALLERRARREPLAY